MDESNPQIPVLTGEPPASSLKVGPNAHNLAAAATQRHPVDDLQRRLDNPDFGTDLQHVRKIYGSGLAMRLATEQKIAANYEQTSRMTGLANSHRASLYREITSGNDVKLDFGNFLSLPQHRPNVPAENPHANMERQLGM